MERRTIDEWHKETSDLIYTSNNELMPMIHQMIDVLKTFKENNGSHKALRVPINELIHQYNKAYILDTKRDTELHQMFFALAQCITELNTAHNPPSSTPSVTRYCNSKGSINDGSISYRVIRSRATIPNPEKVRSSENCSETSLDSQLEIDFADRKSEALLKSDVF